jgi:hypothetical protein
VYCKAFGLSTIEYMVELVAAVLDFGLLNMSCLYTVEEGLKILSAWLQGFGVKKFVAPLGDFFCSMFLKGFCCLSIERLNVISFGAILP